MRRVLCELGGVQGGRRVSARRAGSGGGGLRSRPAGGVQRCVMTTASILPQVLEGVLGFPLGRLLSCPAKHCAVTQRFPLSQLLALLSVLPAVQTPCSSLLWPINPCPVL